MDTYICKVCGYVSFGSAPEKCPVCGAPKQAFNLTADAIHKPADPSNLAEGDRKHIPVIEIRKQCGIVGSGCIDAIVKIGSIIHVMESKHYIMYIDAYLDNNFIARYHMTPSVNPILSLHLKASAGKLLVLENCNIHGRWMSEAVI
ncbi:MAG: desulfoferrodoxin family protein [Candidatus Omnitrophota bacterium]|nr:hypothetical protein [Candidatus Omnitrophota bacterium]